MKDFSPPKAENVVSIAYKQQNSLVKAVQKVKFLLIKNSEYTWHIVYLALSTMCVDLPINHVAGKF